MLAIILAAFAATPTPEAERLGRQLAAAGAIETLLPAIAANETEEVIGRHPELSDEDKRRMRETGQKVVAAARDRLVEAIGHEYAATLSLADLRALVAFNRTPAATHYRAAMPGVTMRGLGKLGKVDFKEDLTRAFCTQTGKLCPH